MIFVITARVPSEPARRWTKSYPVTSLRRLPPNQVTDPSASTASSPRTWAPVAPYLITLLPPAFSATLPPMKEASPLQGSPA